MPVIGLCTGGMDFSEMKYVMQEAVMNGEEVITPEVAIGYGQFIQYIIDFIIVAFCIFGPYEIMVGFYLLDCYKRKLSDASSLSFS